jgi:small subunit ribosomal protein S17
MEKKQRVLTGKLIKKSSLNTVKVRVEKKQPHPLYGKVITSHKNYLVDCTAEQFEAATIGEKVTIGEIRPISKMKSWQLLPTNNKA